MEKEKEKRYILVNDQDRNVRRELEASSEKEALHEALGKLGWYLTVEEKRT